MLGQGMTQVHKPWTIWVFCQKGVEHQAVATGDHLACSAPVPRAQCASSTISCPGRILASKMSSCTRLTGSAPMQSVPKLHTANARRRLRPFKMVC